MSNSWKDRKRALEEGYFDKQNKAALERISAKLQAVKARVSPVTGKDMEQITVMGVVIDRCKDSGGIWLDGGELEQIIKAASQYSDPGEWLHDFMKQLNG
jgi:hypothetical protein